MNNTLSLDTRERSSALADDAASTALAPGVIAPEPREPAEPIGRSRSRRPRWRLAGVLVSGTFLALLVLAAVFPAQFATHDPNEITLGAILSGPTGENLLGTDDIGRDVFSRLIHGAGASLSIGFGATLIGLLGGTVLGLTAGLGTRVVDATLMRFVDCLVAVPDILLAMIVITIAGGGTRNAMIAVGLASVPSYARIIRAQTHVVRVSPYIEAARTLGLSRLSVARRHVLPNAFRPLIPLVALGIGSAIGTGAALSFLGLGAQPPDAEWGAMIASGRNFLAIAPSLVLLPALVVTFTVLAVGVLGRELKRRLEGRAL